MRSKKNKKKLLIAITLGLIATAGVFNMMNSQKASLEASIAKQQAAALATMQSQTTVTVPDNETTNVILAKTDIKSGEIITLNKIEKKEYKKNELPPSFFFNENFVLGKIAAQDILAGKIVTNEDILAMSENSLNIPSGMRAITIPTSLIQGLASYIYIGSKIDLISIKSPPEFIAQNIKIIALETTVDYSAKETTPQETTAKAPAPPKPSESSAPLAPAQLAQPADTTASPEANTVISPSSAGIKSTSADKALGITILVPVETAKKIIFAMIEGKLQVITRGRNDDKIIKQSSSSFSSSSSIRKLPSDISSLLPPPPPSGTGKLPSLPGVISPKNIPVEQPKVEVEVIEANNKRQVSFDDTRKSPASTSSKDIKELLKGLN